MYIVSTYIQLQSINFGYLKGFSILYLNREPKCSFRDGKIHPQTYSKQMSCKIDNLQLLFVVEI